MAGIVGIVSAQGPHIWAAVLPDQSINLPEVLSNCKVF